MFIEHSPMPGSGWATGIQGWKKANPCPKEPMACDSDSHSALGCEVYGSTDLSAQVEIQPPVKASSEAQA